MEAAARLRRAERRRQRGSGARAGNRPQRGSGVRRGVSQPKRRVCRFLWWPRRAFPTGENTSVRRRSAGKYVTPPSERRRSAVSPPSVRRLAVGPDRRRSAVGSPSDRRRTAVGQPSDRRRTAVGPPSRRSKDARAQARERGYQYMRISVYVLYIAPRKYFERA